MHWNFDPIAIDLGFWQIRWYGITFMTGLLIGTSLLPGALKRRGLPPERANELTIWVPIGMLLGAHFIHLLFYEPDAFIHHPKRIFEVGLGLASHGGGLGAFIATWLIARKHREPLHKYMDVVTYGAVWVIPFVRIGNFFNSEIYGRPTDLPWGVIFDRAYHAGGIPRHPSQLYEAAIGFALAGLTVYLEKKRARRMYDGALTYFVIGLYFVTRFLIEYVKEYQVISPSFPLTMGQMLSIPFALGFLYMALFSKRHNIWTLDAEAVAQREADAERAAELEEEEVGRGTKNKPRKKRATRKRRKKPGAIESEATGMHKENESDNGVSETDEADDSSKSADKPSTEAASDAQTSPASSS